MSTHNTQDVVMIQKPNGTVTRQSAVEAICDQINYIRADQDKLLHGHIPDIINKCESLEALTQSHELIKSSISNLENKINALVNKTDTILLLLNSAASIHPTQGTTSSNPNVQSAPRCVSVRYCDQEIPDNDLINKDSDELKKLKQNIHSAIWRYKQSGKQDKINMCQHNIDKINNRLQPRS